MQKVMFNERYGLRSATLQGTKWKTRRMEKSLALLPTALGERESLIHHKEGDKFVVEYYNRGILTRYEIVPKYKVGEVVAVAQSYKEAGFTPDLVQNGKRVRVTAHSDPGAEDKIGWICDCYFDELAGWDNSMFVRADLMPHNIYITDVCLERLQDISDEDCLAEGIVYEPKGVAPYCYKVGDGLWKCYRTPQDAYSTLIDRISGKGTWEKNPWVIVYSYELIC